MYLPCLHLLLPFAFMTLYGLICVGLCLGNLFHVPGPTIHVIKRFLFLYSCSTFCPMLGILFGGVTVHICCISYLGHAFGLVANTITFSVLEVNFINTCCYGNSSSWTLCQLKSFTVISCSLACWEKVLICDVLSSLLSIRPFS